MKQLGEMTAELERTLAEIELQFEIIDKDADYLNDTQMSPMKGSSSPKRLDRQSTGSAVSFKSAGVIKQDLEKTQVMGKQMKKIEAIKK